MDIYEQLLRDEGLELRPYMDTVGKLTIGVGRNLTDLGITQDEALYLLRNDVERVIQELESHVDLAALSPARAGVLINMAFNTGTPRLIGFKRMLRAVNAGDYVLAAAEMLNSVWAGQVGQRAQRLAQQMETGEWA